MQICVFGYHKIIYISGYVQGEKWDMYNFNLKFEQSWIYIMINPSLNLFHYGHFVTHLLHSFYKNNLA